MTINTNKAIQATKVDQVKASDTCAVIEQMFSDYGGQHYGEQCDQLIHAISCAHHAKQDNAPTLLIVAALLHDIGHFIADQQQLEGFDQWGHVNHAEIGANWLAQREFPASVYQPIRYHVEAKRYLAAKSNEQKRIAVSLSYASEQTLQQQGGRMSEQQQKLFELNPFFHQAVALRQYDDLGKPNEPITVSLTPWLLMIKQILAIKY
ncbi:HD domain-containing protein [Colwellia sp. MSW7]|jgi:putative nucleotidyltransferase with HDIG domain|uniref:HD domain-containing protein n=1 Tax=Colwellia maritima TaxID=2912588 RepID=A0ABS9WW72_9GAMM|nr:HD domain-containing protein [Colwellia maritima]MCI2282194.1 HD domain-containing protein [Colwellia maritima]